MAVHPLQLVAVIPDPAPAVPLDCLAVYQQEFDYLYRTLRRLGVRSSDIEDVAHEVFLVLHRRWGAYDPTRPLRPWLFGIAFRVASSQKRRSGRELPYEHLEVTDAAPHPEQALHTQEARALVVAALDRIPLERRAALVLHDIDGVAMRDVALVLSIPLFTAYSRLRKARKELAAAVDLLRERAVPR